MPSWAAPSSAGDLALMGQGGAGNNAEAPFGHVCTQGRMSRLWCVCWWHCMTGWYCGTAFLLHSTILATAGGHGVHRPLACPVEGPHSDQAHRGGRVQQGVCAWSSPCKLLCVGCMRVFACAWGSTGPLPRAASPPPLLPPWQVWLGRWGEHDVAIKQMGPPSALGAQTSEHGWRSIAHRRPAAVGRPSPDWC